MYALRPTVGSIMTSVYLAILNTKTKAKLAEYIPPVAVQAGLPVTSTGALLQAIAAGTVEAMNKVPGITLEVQEAVAAELPYAYAAAYAYVYYAAVAVGCVGLIACFCIKDYDPLFTNHVSRRIYKASEATDENIAEKPSIEMWEDREQRGGTNSPSHHSNGVPTTLGE